MRNRNPIALTVAALIACAPWPCVAGVVLKAGDLVLVDSFIYPPAAPALWRLDPATLDTTVITQGGLLRRPDRITVDRAGIVYVADRVSGIVRVDAGTGAQSVLASPAALGGTARGICLAGDGTLFVTVSAPASGVLSVNPLTGDVRTVTQGGLLENPSCIAVGPDGALYVGDESANGAVGGSGSIVRVETSGGQTLFSNDALFRAPFDIAITADGWVWTAQWGVLSRRGGGFRRTRLADGTTEAVESDRSQGVVATPDGDVLLGDCISISLDCYPGYRYVRRFSGGSQRYLPSGGMAVVPAGSTPARRSTWGAIKTIYR